MLIKSRAEFLESLHDATAARYHVLLLFHEKSLFVVHHEGAPASILPQRGEHLPVLLTVPTSKVTTSYLTSVKETSSHDIVCSNPGNVWGKILHGHKLLRRAGARLYTISEAHGWDDPTPVAGGYLESFTLTPTSMTLLVYS